MKEKVKLRLFYLYCTLLSNLLVAGGYECNEKVAENLKGCANSLSYMNLQVFWKYVEELKSDYIEVYRLFDVKLIGDYVSYFPDIWTKDKTWTPLAFKFVDNNRIEIQSLEKPTGVGDILYIADLWE